MSLKDLCRITLIIYINVQEHAMTCERGSGNKDFIALSHFKIPNLSLGSAFKYVTPFRNSC